ncbi:MAG: iron hydrogenase [Oscillospiraceae bacterium]|jgi:iron only hydrogenase large subunit-like protein|nr:iron hydrogenase [Oscillospiraceae bacterium]
MTFEDLYQELTHDKAQNKPINLSGLKYDKNHMDCLLHPDSHPLVWKIGDCACSDKSCVAACLFDAVEIKNGTIAFDREKCTGCHECIDACKAHNLEQSRDIIKAIEILKESEKDVYALMAPAFVGQFGKEATPSKIRTALKQIGFAGMVEVATFADILTLKEALEFKKNSENKTFQLTSCCCPIWISMIKRNYTDIVDHLPPAVSPMIAAGRIVKQLNPECKTIFIGPCLAKKAESKEKGVAGAVDCVLTFQELNDIFKAFQVDFSKLDETMKEHSSILGRLYARTGGVSEAVSLTAQRLQVERPLRPVYANGVKNCKELLTSILNGDIKGNFYEGMGCIGGCVGGPKRVIDLDTGTAFVDQYALESLYITPLDNPYVIEIINRLNFKTVDEFLQNSDILTRDFND